MSKLYSQKILILMLLMGWGNFASFAESPPLLSLVQAQQALFPGQHEFSAIPVELSSAILDRVEDKAGVRVSSKRILAWQVKSRGEDKGWFFVDKVIGKHEFITYALAVDQNGKIKGLEILEYLETHGWQIKDALWRAQFTNKQVTVDKIKLGKGIDGISGATLSCRNVTDGVRKLLILKDYINTSKVIKG